MFCPWICLLLSCKEFHAWIKSTGLGFRCLFGGRTHSQKCMYNRGTCPSSCRQLDWLLLGSQPLPPLTGAGMNFSRAEFRLWALDLFSKHSFSWHVQQTQIWHLLPHLVLHQCCCLLWSLILKSLLISKWAQSQHADHQTHLARIPCCLLKTNTLKWREGNDTKALT